MTRPHCLYRFYAGDVLLYAGMTLDLPGRWRDHRSAKPWWQEVTAATVEHFGSRQEAAQAERAAIRHEHPLHNIVHNRPEDGSVADLEDGPPYYCMLGHKIDPGRLAYRICGGGLCCERHLTSRLLDDCTAIGSPCDLAMAALTGGLTLTGPEAGALYRWLGGAVPSCGTAELDHE